MATTPNKLITPQFVKTYTQFCTAAKTNLTDTSNVKKLTVGTDTLNGALVKRIRVSGRGTNATDIQCQIYRSYDAGVTLFLYETIVLPAYTLAVTTSVPFVEFSPTSDFPMRLANGSPGEEVWCAISTASATGVIFTAEVEGY